MPGSVSLGQMIAEATENADEDTKNFYAGFLQFVDAMDATDAVREDSPGEEIALDSEEEAVSDAEPKTALMAALSNSHIDVAKTLIDAGAQYITSFLTAAEKGQVEIVRALIAAGANVNWGFFDYTPLTLAVRNGHTEAVKVLIEAGANVNRTDEDGGTVLMACSLLRLL